MVSFTDHYNTILIDRLLSKTKIGKNSWKRFMRIILLRKHEFSLATKTSFFIKNTKNNHSSASDWWEYTKYCFKENPKILSKNSTAEDLVSRRMLEIFLKVQPLKKRLQFEERICFFFKKQTKKKLLQQVSGVEIANLALKRMLELFLKVPLSKKY